MDYSEVSEAEEEQMDSTEEMPRKRELLQSALLSMEHNFAVTKQMLFKEKHQFYEKKLKELREKQRLADKLEGKLFELRESLKKSRKTKFAFPIAKKKRRNSMAELPSIVYHLTDNEIDTDLQAFRKIAKASGRKRVSSTANSKNSTTENVITLECSGIDML
ncbi:Oidioi.mRNA.OKI2018_I69.chr1.g2216.t1.cds [Oikopleura dioica]|uniref:Oidioi.mRNA.OKI2018_I69.chr1.g2216.t1.cds n=1 Tax=Oikopleura dioica TaxID=34765 RepID=A0ABN7SQF4_OIKDI|nr:Oidioi.mRNA.OKI2018_I69.chr1.g2216.t1.cds [Oikopleura dioica]